MKEQKEVREWSEEYSGREKTNKYKNGTKALVHLSNFLNSPVLVSEYSLK